MIKMLRILIFGQDSFAFDKKLSEAPKNDSISSVMHKKLDKNSSFFAKVLIFFWNCSIMGYVEK